MADAAPEAVVYRRRALAFDSGPPDRIIDRLERRGKTRCALLGGARVFTDFLKARLIDEFWITFEPVLFGSGKTLLEDCVDCPMELIAIEKLGGSVLVAKYRP